MVDQRIQSIVIVGGGTAGWMAAAMFSHFYSRNPTARITLVESEQIGTVGVGEATVPQILDFLRRLQIDEASFIRATHGTYKLGIRFDGWAGEGTSFLHPFADHGASIAGLSFQHHWVRLRAAGLAGPLDDYCLASHIALRGRFALPRRGDNGSYAFNYALHFDALLAAAFLRDWSVERGVEHKRATVREVARDDESGDIKALTLDDGSSLEGDFFIDCSGFGGLLIEQTLDSGFDDWSHWLPCDRALAMPCESRLPPAPFTRSLARSAGWQWRIPLQHRVGNGYVFCSDFISEDVARAALEAELEGPALAEPRLLRFTAGMRRQIWHHNVVALGLASGFLEPLESTSIYLVQKGLSALLSAFPTKTSMAAQRSAYNRDMARHWRHLRDFIILHYQLNGRHGEPFWDERRSMPMPESLAEKIDLFRETGRLDGETSDFFRASSWLALFGGLGLLPAYHHPTADDFALQEVASELEAMKAAMIEAAETAPLHGDFVARNCAMATHG